MRGGANAQRTLQNLALGAWVAGVRQAAGLKQAELAARAGVSQPWLSKAEAGRKAPDVYMLGKVAQALGSTAAGALAAAGRLEEAMLRAASALMGSTVPATAEELLAVLGEDTLAALAAAAARVQAAAPTPRRHRGKALAEW